MDRAQLDAAYNNCAAVREHDPIVAGWAARSAKERREYAGRLDLAHVNRLDLAYVNRVRKAEFPDAGHDKLRRVFGKDKVTMFEMNKHVAGHLK